MCIRSVPELICSLIDSSYLKYNTWWRLLQVPVDGSRAGEAYRALLASPQFLGNAFGSDSQKAEGFVSHELYNFSNAMWQCAHWGRKTRINKINQKWLKSISPTHFFLGQVTFSLSQETSVLPAVSSHCKEERRGICLTMNLICLLRLSWRNVFKQTKTYICKSFLKGAIYNIQQHVTYS